MFQQSQCVQLVEEMIVIACKMLRVQVCWKCESIWLLSVFGNGHNQSELDGGGDCGVALIYTQFVTLCVKMVMLTKCWNWNECQSTIGRERQHTSQ